MRGTTTGTPRATPSADRPGHHVLLRFRIRPPAQAGGLAAVERTVDVEAPGPEVDVSLGRRAGVAIQLPYGTVSGVHARVVGASGRWTIEDLGSANGTYRIGKGPEAGRGPRLPAGEPHPLAEGEAIGLADVTVVFEGVAAVRSVEVVTETTATLARRLVADFFGACRPAEVARLVVEEGPDAGRSLALTVVGRPYRAGRATGCDLVLTDDDVSREHVAFERGWDGVQVRDLGSKNGVELDGRRLEGGRRLHDGEAVVVGSTRIRLDDPEDRYLRAMQEEDGRRTEVPAAEKPSPRPAAPSKPAAPAPSGVPARIGGGPLLIASVALLVLAGVGILVAWFLLGDWS
jgi:pSer/pThr/pTyr-binding forkhead associated (FHA) protein